MKTSVIAIIVVVIIAVAAVGTYFLLTNNNNNATDTDYIVRDKAIVGDYIEMRASITADNVTELTDKTMIEVLYDLYIAVDEKEKIGTQSYTYKGSSIMCDLYQSVTEYNTLTYLIDPSSGVIYRYTSDYGTLTSSGSLIDSNYDLSKTMVEQEISVGKYTQYELTSEINTENTSVYSTGTTTNTVSAVIPSDDEDYLYNVTMASSSTMTRETKLVVESINTDGTLNITGSSEPMANDDFIAMISYSKYIDKLRSTGADITMGERTVGKSETVFGMREITIQEAVLKDSGVTGDVTFTFGNADVLYTIQAEQVADMESTQFVEILGSSLISVKN